MKLRRLLFGMLAVMCVVTVGVPDEAGAGTGPPQGVGVFAADDPQMLAAYDMARHTFGEFVAILDGNAGEASMLAVKIPIVDGEVTEYFWINNFSHDGDRFSGDVADDPAVVRTVVFGQRISFSRSEIVDWHYVKDGRMRGSFTTCVQLSRENPRKARRLERKIGLTCDEGA